jgi:hypothetical protein
MEWSVDEISAVDAVLSDLETMKVQREAGIRDRVVELSTLAAAGLADECPNPRAQLVRHLCSQMGFTETRLTVLRLEHKLIQALVLMRYCADAIPITCGAMSRIRGVRPSSVRAFLRRHYPPGSVFVKRTLNYGSAERNESDAREECLKAIEKGELSESDDGLASEAFVLQERVVIAQEYRVHTVEGVVAADLTYRRYSGGITPAERESVNRFTQGVLDRLPDALVSGVVGAWDIASTADGRFRVIELNITGKHLVYVPGFHCSGYFLGRWAAPAVAKLAVELERRYGVTFALTIRDEESLALREVFQRFGRWLELQRVARAVERLSGLAPRRATEPQRALSEEVEERAFMSVLGGLENIGTQLRMLT